MAIFALVKKKIFSLEGYNKFIGFVHYLPVALQGYD